MATAGDIIATAASIEDKLKAKLEATDVVRACDRMFSKHHPRPDITQHC
jgi:hypothetical protein